MSDDAKDPLIPLSLSQQEVWLDQLAWPDSTHLNIGGCLELNGLLDETTLQQALSLMVQANDALRLVPLKSGGQKRLTTLPARLHIIDFTHLPDDAAISACQEYELTSIGSNLISDFSPPWQFSYLKASPNRSFLVIHFHHSIMDGWGTTLIIKSWSEIYNAMLKNESVNLATSNSYLDYISATQTTPETASYKKSRDYWVDVLKGINGGIFKKKYQCGSPYSLPSAHTLKLPVKRTLYEQLTQLAVEEKGTIYHAILACTAVYLSKAYHKPKVVIGVPSLNRAGNKYKNTMGMFVGVLPLVIEVNLEQSWLALLHQITRALRQAYRHTKCPLTHIKQAKTKHAKVGSERLFDVILSYENQDYEANFGTSKGMNSWQTFSGIGRFPLGITLCEFHSEENVELVLEGSASFFENAEVQLVGKRLLSLIAQFSSTPNLPIRQANILPAEERQSLMFVSTGAVRERSDNDTVVSRIACMTRLAPNSTAFRFESETLTYSQLWHEALSLASRIQSYGVNNGGIVAIGMERGPESVIAMLAAHISGAAFLPLDVHAPIERLRHILSDSGTNLIVVQVHWWDRFINLNVPTLEYQLNSSSKAALSDLNTRGNQPSTDTLACIYYTSGTSGYPKGVLISHQALISRIDWITRQWQIGSDDRSLQATQLTFDPSLIEIFAPLTVGGSVAFPPPGRLRPETLSGLCDDYHVTLIAFVPTTLRRFLDGPGAKSSLRVLCCGGESLPSSLVNRVLTETRATLYNVYGPTEATIFATAHNCNNASQTTSSIPIGQAIDNTQVLILDRDHNVMPFGVLGEIAISGNGLAEGCTVVEQQPQRFVSITNNDAPERWYCTGDEGWIDTNGTLYFAGRNDRQVKLRGYRIELQEVESALLSHPNIHHAFADIVEEGGQQKLCAWLLSDLISDNQIQTHLRQWLPDYMQPARYYRVKQWPETATGKVDINRLKILTDDREYFIEKREASPGLEQDLLTVWQDVLQQPELTVLDNFFIHGGDSLLAVTLLSRMDDEMGIKLPLYQLVDNPTVSTLVESLNAQNGRPSTLVSLGTTTRKASLYICASGHGDIIRFKALAKELKGVCDVHMLQPPESDQILTFETLAKIYANRIISRQDQQIFLAGFSVGGVAALETCFQLERRHCHVQQLFLIDTIWLPLPHWLFPLWKWYSSLASRARSNTVIRPQRTVAQAYQDKGLKMQIRAMSQHKPKRIECNTLLVKTSANIRWQNMLFSKWRSVLKGQLKEATIKGNHHAIFGPGTVKKLSRIISFNLSKGIDKKTHAKNTEAIE